MISAGKGVSVDPTVVRFGYQKACMRTFVWVCILVCACACVLCACTIWLSTTCCSETLMWAFMVVHICVCACARVLSGFASFVCVWWRMSTCCSWALRLCICVDGCVCVYDRTNVRNFSLCMCVYDEECQSVVRGRCACVSGLIGVRAYDRTNVRNFSLCMGWLRLVGSLKL